MLRNTKSGFTLIELIISIAIFGSLAIVGARLVYDAVSYRSKQYAVDESSEAVRSVINTIAEPVHTSIQMTISTNQLVINGFAVDGTQTCTSIKYNSANKSIESAKSSIDCQTLAHTALHSNLVQIASFTVEQDASHLNTVNISLTGNYKDSIGTHPFSSHTSVSSKAML